MLSRKLEVFAENDFGRFGIHYDSDRQTLVVDRAVTVNVQVSELVSCSIMNHLSKLRVQDAFSAKA
jgi:hypothetical protein